MSRVYVERQHVEDGSISAHAGAVAARPSDENKADTRDKAVKKVVQYIQSASFIRTVMHTASNVQYRVSSIG